MKKTRSVIIVSVSIIMIFFIGIGYAVLVDNLSVTGHTDVEGKAFSGVYIKSVEIVGNPNAEIIVNDIVLPTTHKTTVDATASGESVTYKITVHNNTDVTYWYVGPRCSNDYGQNSIVGNSGNGIKISTKDQIGDSYSSFDTNDWVPPQTERVFYVTYTYGSNAQSACATMVNFHFDIRMDAVYDEFLAILNSTEDYNVLKNVFEEEYADNGSMSITTESHPEVFERFFDDLVVNIDGVEREASVVIRRENLDNDAVSGDDYNGSGAKGCEYSLYITVEPLTPGTSPKVYAIAYSKEAANMGENWYQVGELYEGTAPVKADGSIDFENWIATEKTYEIADGIDYKVAAPNGDQYDIMKTLEQLISAEDQDVFNQIDNTNIFKKTYDIIQKHITSSDPSVDGLKKAFDEASVFYNNLNNGQEFKVVRGKYTRAEIIRALKNIQSALDYYYQTFPQ